MEQIDNAQHLSEVQVLFLLYHHCYPKESGRPENPFSVLAKLDPQYNAALYIGSYIVGLALHEA